MPCPFEYYVSAPVRISFPLSISLSLVRMVCVSPAFVCDCLLMMRLLRKLQQVLPVNNVFGLNGALRMTLRVILFLSPHWTRPQRSRTVAHLQHAHIPIYKQRQTNGYNCNIPRFTFEFAYVIDMR